MYEEPEPCTNNWQALHLFSYKVTDHLVLQINLWEEDVLGDTQDPSTKAFDIAGMRQDMTEKSLSSKGQRIYLIPKLLIFPCTDGNSTENLLK